MAPTSGASSSVAQNMAPRFRSCLALPCFSPCLTTHATAAALSLLPRAATRSPSPVGLGCARRRRVGTRRGKRCAGVGSYRNRLRLLSLHCAALHCAHEPSPDSRPIPNRHRAHHSSLTKLDVLGTYLGRSRLQSRCSAGQPRPLWVHDTCQDQNGNAHTAQMASATPSLAAMSPPAWQNHRLAVVTRPSPSKPVRI